MFSNSLPSDETSFRDVLPSELQNTICQATETSSSLMSPLSISVREENEDETDSTAATAATAASPKAEDASVGNSYNLSIVRLDVSMILQKCRNVNTVSDEGSIIDLSLNKMPGLQNKFNKYAIIGSIKFSISQISDVLRSFLERNNNKIEALYEVLSLFAEIQFKCPSQELAELILSQIMDETFQQQLLQIIVKLDIISTDDAFDFYRSCIYTLLLEKKLRFIVCLCFVVCVVCNGMCF